MYLCCCSLHRWFKASWFYLYASSSVSCVGMDMCTCVYVCMSRGQKGSEGDVEQLLYWLSFLLLSFSPSLPLPLSLPPFLRDSELEAFHLATVLMRHRDLVLLTAIDVGVASLSHSVFLCGFWGLEHKSSCDRHN